MEESTIYLDKKLTTYEIKSGRILLAREQVKQELADLVSQDLKLDAVDESGNTHALLLKASQGNRIMLEQAGSYIRGRGFQSGDSIQLCKRGSGVWEVRALVTPRPAPTVVPLQAAAAAAARDDGAGLDDDGGKEGEDWAAGAAGEDAAGASGAAASGGRARRKPRFRHGGDVDFSRLLGGQGGSGAERYLTEGAGGLSGEGSEGESWDQADGSTGDAMPGQEEGTAGEEQDIFEAAAAAAASGLPPRGAKRGPKPRKAGVPAGGSGRGGRGGRGGGGGRDYDSKTGTPVKRSSGAAAGAMPGHHAYQAYNHHGISYGSMDHPAWRPENRLQLPTDHFQAQAAAEAAARAIAEANAAANFAAAAVVNYHRDFGSAAMANSSGAGGEGGEGAAAAEAAGLTNKYTVLVAKVLTNSDANSGRIILPRVAVEANLSFVMSYRSYALNVKDRDGHPWEFVIKSWANGTEHRRVYVLEQTNDYLKAYGLGVGDAVGICTDEEGALIVEANTPAVRSSTVRPTYGALSLQAVLPPAPGKSTPLLIGNPGKCTRNPYCTKPASHPGFCSGPRGPGPRKEGSNVGRRRGSQLERVRDEIELDEEELLALRNQSAVGTAGAEGAGASGSGGGEGGRPYRRAAAAGVAAATAAAAGADIDDYTDYEEPAPASAGRPHSSSAAAAAAAAAAMPKLFDDAVVLGKSLTDNDVLQGRLVLPRGMIEQTLPEARSRSSSYHLSVSDASGKSWGVTIKSFVSQSNRMYFLEGASAMIAEHRLKAQDCIAIVRAAPGHGGMVLEVNTERAKAAAETARTLAQQDGSNAAKAAADAAAAANTSAPDAFAAAAAAAMAASASAMPDGAGAGAAPGGGGPAHMMTFSTSFLPSSLATPPGGVLICTRTPGCSKPAGHQGFCSGHKGFRRKQVPLWPGIPGGADWPAGAGDQLTSMAAAALQHAAGGGGDQHVPQGGAGGHGPGGEAKKRKKKAKASQPEGSGSDDDDGATELGILPLTVGSGARGQAHAGFAAGAKPPMPAEVSVRCAHVTGRYLVAENVVIGTSETVRGKRMSPSEFERQGGKGHIKKWRDTLWIDDGSTSTDGRGPGAGLHLGQWLKAHGASIKTRGGSKNADGEGGKAGKGGMTGLDAAAAAAAAAALAAKAGLTMPAAARNALLANMVAGAGGKDSSQAADMLLSLLQNMGQGADASSMAALLTASAAGAASSGLPPKAKKLKTAKKPAGEGGEGEGSQTQTLAEALLAGSASTSADASGSTAAGLSSASMSLFDNLLSTLGKISPLMNAGAAAAAAAAAGVGATTTGGLPGMTLASAAPLNLAPLHPLDASIGGGGGGGGASTSAAAAVADGSADGSAAQGTAAAAAAAAAAGGSSSGGGGGGGVTDQYVQLLQYMTNPGLMLFQQQSNFGATLAAMQAAPQLEVAPLQADTAAIAAIAADALAASAGEGEHQVGEAAAGEASQDEPTAAGAIGIVPTMMDMDVPAAAEHQML